MSNEQLPALPEPVAWYCTSCSGLQLHEGAEAGDNWCSECGSVGTMKRMVAAHAVLQRDKQIAAITRRVEKAEHTLVAAGYTDEGGELWRPPLRPFAAPLLERIDSLTAEVESLRAELDLRRNSGSAVDRLHNLCAAISAEADGSEWSREEWERIDAENAALRAEVKALRAKRVPLTDEQIVDMARDADLDWQRGWALDGGQNRYEAFARAIERAHGIDAARAESVCLDCNGTGDVDSGGIHPWGSPAYIACHCPAGQGAARAEAKPAGSSCDTYETSSGDHTICKTCGECWPTSIGTACEREVMRQERIKSLAARVKAPRSET